MAEEKLPVKVERSDFKELPSGTLCQVTFAGPVTEVTSMLHWPSPPPVRKLDAERFWDIRTGEIKEYKQSETRADNYDSLRKTFRRIRWLVNANCEEPKKCRWVTLTYAENMTDPKRLHRDYSAFWKRFCRYCDKMGYGRPEYLSVVEPQGRGAWHVHAFFIWPDQAPFIPNHELASIWSYGFVNIRKMESCDNLGAYFSAYLADAPLEECKGYDGEVKTVVINGKEKKFVKGGRLHMYPPGMNIYRKSRGIKEPRSFMCEKDDVETNKVALGQATYKDCYTMVRAGQAVNIITREYYNTNRKK